MINIKTFVFNDFYQNTYVIFDPISLEGAVIDPGCSNENEKKELAGFIDEKKIIIKYLLNTHCHIDHIFGNKFVKEKYNCVFYCGKEDEFLLDLMPKEADKWGYKMEVSPKPDKYFEHNGEIKIGSISIKTLHTPGHSPGEFSFYIESDGVCFTGDVLFKEAIGRTDLWGGDYDVIADSIQKLLFSLPDSTIIYPGHGETSTIGYEKIKNPFL